MRRPAWVAVAAGLLMAGCDSQPAPVPADSKAAPPASVESAATRGYKASMTGMMHAAPPYSGDPDVDFNRQMKVHHQAAVAMAEVELAHGRDPRSLALARAVIAAQRSEITQIDEWLARHAGR